MERNVRARWSSVIACLLISLLVVACGGREAEIAEAEESGELPTVVATYTPLSEEALAAGLDAEIATSEPDAVEPDTVEIDAVEPTVDAEADTEVEAVEPVADEVIEELAEEPTPEPTAVELAEEVTVEATVIPEVEPTAVLEADAVDDEIIEATEPATDDEVVVNDETETGEAATTLNDETDESEIIDEDVLGSDANDTDEVGIDEEAVAEEGVSDAVTTLGAQETASEQSEAATQGTTFDVLMNDLYFGEENNNIADPPVWTVQSGEEVGLTLINNGALQHNWAIVEQGEEVPVPYVPEEGEDILLYNPGIVNGGQEQSAAFTAPEVGEYLIICTVAGHYPAMQGRLVVE